MVDLEIKYTLVEKETGEGLYIVSVDSSKYVTYIRNKEELKKLKSQKELLSDEILEIKGIYLLKNIKELFHNAEEKTKKIIKYLIADKDKIESEAMKIFIIMLTTYIAYQDIYLNAIVKDPTLIDFFKEPESNKDKDKEDNKKKIEKNIKLEILQNLFYYILESKGLLSKLDISKKYAEIIVSFVEIDKNRGIFNKDIIDPGLVSGLFNAIRENFGIKKEQANL
jgi:hypothetical protein